MLPRIKADAESAFNLPVVRIAERKHKSLDKTMYQIRNMKAIKVNDITESMSKDLPKTLFRSVVITPRRTMRIFASIDVSSSCEPRIYQGSRRDYRNNKRNLFKLQKNHGLEKIMKDIENVSVLGKNSRGLQGSPATRPVSPWLYQGNSRRYSIFANK